MPGLVHGSAVMGMAVRQLHPTVIIALGGTGKEVALRLRQRFFEKYGVTGFPTMGYLWIDTDMQNNNINNQPLNYIGAGCLFQPGEYVDAQIPGNVFQNYFINHQFHPHIFKWLYPELGRLGAVVNGAQATRPLGRLAFFHAFPQIHAALTNLVARVSGAGAILAAQNNFGITVTPGRLDFRIIFSVAGGTGSGMFLDMAFLVREHYATANPDIVGYMVLPAVFGANYQTPRAEREYANGYAALKELEFYSMRKDLRQDEAMALANAGIMEVSAHDFDYTWHNNIPPRPVVGPPFNTCYLISNSTEVGGHLLPEEKTYLCDMLAESLFMDFHADAFCTAKRSVRSNLEQFLAKDLEFRYLDVQANVIHQELFSCRFSTQGFSMIHVPLDRLRNACGYKLALEILDRLLSHQDLPDVESHLHEYYLQPLRLQVSQEAGNEFFQDLSRLPEHVTFYQDITNTWQKHKHHLMRLVGDPQIRLSDELQQKMQQFNAEKMAHPQANLQAWGEYPRLLGRPGVKSQSNRVEFLKSRLSLIEEEVKNWTGTEQIRIHAALDLLEGIKQILHQHQQYFADRAKEWEHLADQAYDRYQQFLNLLVEEEECGRSFYHRWALRVLVGECCDQLSTYFDCLARAMVHQTSGEVSQEFIKQLDSGGLPGKKAQGGIIQKLQSLENDLISMRESTEIKLASFERQAAHLIFENIYSPSMLDDFYVIELPDGTQAPVNLTEMESGIYQDLNIQSPYDLIDMIEHQGLDTVVTKIEDFCHRQFSHLRVNIDAVRKFFERYQLAPERQQRVNEFVSRGLVWMKPGNRAAADPTIGQSYTDWVVLGMNHDGLQSHASYQQLQQNINANLNAATLRCMPEFPVDVNQEAVYLYSERAGIPLPYIHKIEEYRQAYSRQMNTPGNELHIDKNEMRFADITIKTNQEVQVTIEARRLLLVGAMLHLIELERGTELKYYYLTGNPVNPRIPLGTLYGAMENLKQYPDRRLEIARSIVIRTQTMAPEAREQFLTLLFYHITRGEVTPLAIPQGPFALRYIPVGGILVSKESPEFRALNQTLEQECQTYGYDYTARQEIFYRWYPRLDEFSQEFQEVGKTIRIFRNGPVI